MRSKLAKTIAEAYVLKFTAPRAYNDIMYNIENNINPSKQTKRDLLYNFNPPFLNDNTVNKQYDRIAKIIKAKMELDKEVSEAIKDIEIGYHPEF
jgi:hypothetical protein